MDTFARIIAEDVLVFAYCRNDDIDDDFAIAQSERIADQLASSGPETIARFIKAVRAMELEARQEGNTERAERLEDMPNHLGLE